MTISVAVIDELSRALGVPLPDALRDALGRIEAAERGVTAASPVTVVASRGPSKAALRTRKWRAKKSGIGVTTPSPEASPTVTEPSPNVTEPSPKASPKASPVTVGDGGWQKEKSPTPPIRKTSSPKSPPRRQRRHRVTDAETVPVRPQVFLDEHDARSRELGRMRGKPYPVHSGGWWFEPFLVAQAEERIRSTVRPLRPSRLALEVATGPPPAAATG